MTKNQKMENLHKRKIPRLVADFNLDHTGGYGGAYQAKG